MKFLTYTNGSFTWPDLMIWVGLGPKEPTVFTWKGVKGHLYTGRLTDIILFTLSNSLRNRQCEGLAGVKLCFFNKHPQV